jgi:hypothetical protein
VRISDAAFAADLGAHLLRAGFAVEEAGGTMIEVARPDAPSAEQERREVQLQLRVWQATNPGARVDVVG